MVNPHVWGKPESAVSLGSYEYSSDCGLGVRLYKDDDGHQVVAVTPKGVRQTVSVGMVAAVFSDRPPAVGKAIGSHSR